MYRIFSVLLFGFIFLNANGLQAQEEIGQIRAQLQARYGSLYDVSSASKVDEFPFSYNNGSLNGCWIFLTKGNSQGGERPKASVGVFKQGEIVWLSDTLINNNFVMSAQVYDAFDLRGNGEMNIVTSWVEGNGAVEYLWLIAWDGQTGRVINDYDAENRSVIVSRADAFRFAYVDQDPINEIIGDWNNSNTFTDEGNPIVYGWNGQLYGRWPTTPQLPSDGFLPKNLLTVNVKAWCINSGGILRYCYKVQNAQSSTEGLNDFLIDKRAVAYANPTAPSKWRFNVMVDPTVGWSSILETYDDAIKKGSMDSSFSVQCNSVPTILTFYMQGFNPGPTEPSYEVQSWYQDVLTNSNKGVTIGPATPPSSVSVAFIDTLRSLVTRSRSFNWITNQATANKYARLLDTARSYLVANVRGVTKAKLDSVLINVHTDSASTLTSEAYALIRFNTEYLLQKLREEDSTFASGNTSSSFNATATNNARHLAKRGSNVYQVFASGGEIFFRRSTDEASTWDMTSRLNTAIGENSRPCFATTKSGTIHIIWQRRIAPSTYEVWHAYSQDDGANWSAPAILPEAASINVSSYQTEGPMPVIAEGRYLTAVYCSNEGLRYRFSEDDGATWQVPGTDIISGQFNNRVRYPSLAGGESYVSLVYDYVNDNEGPYSRTFDGTNWSNEEKIAKGTGSSDGAFPSVAIDANNNPIAAWSGIVNSYTHSVLFRAGYADNTWSKWFVAFGHGQFAPDWLYPSLTYYKRGGGQDAIAIMNHTSSSSVKLTRYIDNGLIEAPLWETSTLSESGAWANITQENASSGMPFHCWTDQSAFPFEIIAGTSSELARPGSGMTDVRNTLGVSWKRRAVVYHPGLRATLTLDFEPMKIVNANGDTSTVQFKTSPRLLRGERDSIRFSNMWDYLGSGSVALPANARRLVFTKQFATRGPSIGKQRFFLRLLRTNGVPIGTLDSTVNSGTISVNIAPYAGTEIIVRPQVLLTGTKASGVVVSVGDVFTLPADPARQVGKQQKPLRETKGGRK